MVLLKSRGFITAAVLLVPAVSALGPKPGQITNLVTFGDSYTDIIKVGDGGAAWPIYTAAYANLTLYPYAQSGATCSNKLVSRPPLAVIEGQIPMYLAAKSNGTANVRPDNTIHTIWIGTNDVGSNGLLTGFGAPGVTIVDVANCSAVNWVKTLYANGARNFLFQNMVPLQKTPMYAPNSYPDIFFSGHRNTTEWSLFMTELVSSGNALSKLLLQALAPTLPGAHIGIFDSYSLFDDMYAHPANYLNGTAPLNVTSSVRACVLEEGTGALVQCTITNGTDKDSFLWYDELHPSEQADRIVAREIAATITGKGSKWTTWLS